MLPTLTYRPRALRRREVPDINRWFDDFLTGRTFDTWGTWAPTADFYETDDEFVLELEVAGYNRDEVDVTVERGMLTVTGNKVQEEEDADRTYHTRERSYERFARTFSLPHSVTPEDVQAEMENGVLFVRLPKIEEAKPKKIAVKVK